MAYKLHREQQLNCDVQTAWKFFSAAGNLPKITPPEMKFTILSDLPDETIYPGMIINYTVAPILGITLHWKTKILEVFPENNFTDFQEKGPYKLWNHFHEFIPNEKGVLVRDTVDYELPFGILGKIAHALFVKKKLNFIFDYRHKVIEQLFNSQKELS